MPFLKLSADPNYENSKSFVISETGNITSTGWGVSPSAFVLKELKIGSDGIYTGVFYLLNFGMGEFQPSKADLLQGTFGNYGDPPFLVTIVFEEKSDENSEMYLRYYEAKMGARLNCPTNLIRAKKTDLI